MDGNNEEADEVPNIDAFVSLNGEIILNALPQDVSKSYYLCIFENLQNEHRLSKFLSCPVLKQLSDEKDLPHLACMLGNYSRVHVPPSRHLFKTRKEDVKDPIHFVSLGNVTASVRKGARLESTQDTVIISHKKQRGRVGYRVELPEAPAAEPPKKKSKKSAAVLPTATATVPSSPEASISSRRVRRNKPDQTSTATATVPSSPEASTSSRRVRRNIPDQTLTMSELFQLQSKVQTTTQQARALMPASLPSVSKYISTVSGLMPSNCPKPLPTLSPPLPTLY